MSKSGGWVYFIIAGKGQDMRVKIGFTGGDPNARLRNLQCGSPVKLGIYLAFEGDVHMERRFRDTFAPLRLHGEWFALKGKLRDFLLYLMDEAAERRPTKFEMILHAIYDVVLAQEPIIDGEDREEYLATADTRHWDWMIPALEAEGAAA